MLFSAVFLGYVPRYYCISRNFSQKRSSPIFVRSSKICFFLIFLLYFYIAKFGRRLLLSKKVVVVSKKEIIKGKSTKKIYRERLFLLFFIFGSITIDVTTGNENLQAMPLKVSYFGQ